MNFNLEAHDTGESVGSSRLCRDVSQNMTRKYDVFQSKKSQGVAATRRIIICRPCSEHNKGAF